MFDSTSSKDTFRFLSCDHAVEIGCTLTAIRDVTIFNDYPEIAYAETFPVMQFPCVKNT